MQTFANICKYQISFGHNMHQGILFDWMNPVNFLKQGYRGKVMVPDVQLSTHRGLDFLFLVPLDCLFCYLIHVYRSVCFTTHSRQTRLLQNIHSHECIINQLRTTAMCGKVSDMNTLVDSL